jgi:hypothetical protein
LAAALETFAHLELAGCEVDAFFLDVGLLLLGICAPSKSRELFRHLLHHKRERRELAGNALDVLLGRHARADSTRSSSR